MDFNALVAQIGQVFKNLTKQQRYIIIGAIVAVFMLVSGLIVYNWKSETKGDDGFRILFDNLSPQDASLAIAQLEKDKIPYKIPRDGAIEIPTDLVNKERIAIASQGIPKNSRVGFELFDKQEFGATDFDQKVKYTRALEGELSKTVESISAVKSATVHLAQAKESVFTEKDTPPTASVVLALRPNMAITPKQVIGIKNLIASSVPKLTPENVKIVNEQGDLLGADDEETIDNERTKIQTKYKKDYEKALEAKILNVVAPLVGGQNRVTAAVTVEFDFNKKDSISESYDPNSVIRSEQSLEEKKEGVQPDPVGGVPGVVSNIGPVQGLESSKTNEKYQKSQSTTNYEISKTTQNVKGEFATVKRISAAVAVDGKYENNASGEFAYKPLPQADLDQLTNLTKQAIGYNEDRGDTTSVISMQFSEKPKPPSQMQSIFDEYKFVLIPTAEIIKWLIVGALLFVLYKQVILPFADKMLQAKDNEEEEKKDLQELLEPEENDDRLGKVNEIKKRIEKSLGFNEDMNEESLKYDVLIDRLRDRIEEAPEDVANIFSTLLQDELGSSQSGNRR